MGADNVEYRAGRNAQKIPLSWGCISIQKCRIEGDERFGVGGMEERLVRWDVGIDM